MTTHRAAIHPAPGSPCEVKEVPRYTPKASQVLIQITATAINPVDWKVADGLFPFQFPAILGSDAAGIVAEVGDQVSSLAVGDRVYFQGKLGVQESSTFQEYAIMEEALVSKTPDNITDGEASGIQLAGMCALVGLYDASGKLEIKPRPWESGGGQAGKGQAILVLGGSSSVGQYVIQLARLSGFDKIITTSSSIHTDHLKSLGATDVLDRTAGPQEFIKAAGDLEFTAVYDSIGSDETTKQGVSTLQEKNRGTDRISHYVTVLPPHDKVHTNPTVTHKSIFGSGSSPEIAPLSHPWIRALSGNDGLVGRGLFKANRARKIEGGLEKGLQKALDLNKDGVSGVKLWIDPRE